MTFPKEYGVVVLSEADIERSRDRKGAFFELVQMETDAVIKELLESDAYQRAEYERWFNEPFETAVLRQFRKVLAVIGWAAAHCPECQVYWGPVAPHGSWAPHQRWCGFRFVRAWKVGAVCL